MIYKPFEFKPTEIEGLKFKDVQYHRNGVSGDGFYCAVATDKENGDMLITYFPDLGQCACAVYCLSILPNIRFMENSWRGDHYAGAMRQAIAIQDKQYDAWSEREAKKAQKAQKQKKGE